MKSVRLGIIGLGSMGKVHAKCLLDASIDRCRLTAVTAPTNMDPKLLKRFRAGEGVAIYATSSDLICSGVVDAVLIATPHYSHTNIGVAALGQQLHVLVEKPISVHKVDCERLIAANRGEKLVFAAMFNQRVNPCYRKVKQLIDDGKLGALTRVNWIGTDWFRPEAYYRSGGWRATWEGEGGGVLLNQCPHQLDLLQWMFGMPSSVRGFCSFGKYHDIEVEDEITAYFEFPNGATGVLIASTGEAPGTNRLEICGDLGKVVVENGALRFTRNKISMSKFSRTTEKTFAKPAVKEMDIPLDEPNGGHAEVLQNFVDAILDGTPLIAPAREGIHSVELANAILCSSLVGRPIELPLDGTSFLRRLKKLIRDSTHAEKVVDGS